MEDGEGVKDPQSRANELEERLIDFAVRIVKLSASLPKTPAGKHAESSQRRSKLLAQEQSLKDVGQMASEKFEIRYGKSS